jgi:two-component system CheB/CheR fusion protein
VEDSAQEEGRAVPAPGTSDEAFEALLEYLRDSRGADFTGYKRPSLTRLVNRRMRAVGVDSYAEYVDLLQVESGELSSLLDTLLINVTSVFRDPAAWDLLRTQLLPDALASLRPDEPVRVWSAACATGEEAYSLAILLHELLGDEAYKRRVKVYATDIDEGALAVARAGRYPVERLEGLSPEQLDGYFELDGDAYRFRADLRPSLIFGRHDLLTDAPISRVLLLSCRNALMYFTSETQTRVLERFAFALHDAGLLLLGKAEMLLTQSQLFTPVSLTQRVFTARRRPPPAARLAVLAAGGPGSDVARVAEAAFVAAPAAQLVLDASGVVTMINERAEEQLRLTPDHLGRVFAELDVSYRPLELRGAVGAVQASGEPVHLSGVSWTDETGGARWWDVSVTPLRDGDDVLGVHLVFDDVTERQLAGARLDQLEHDLSTAYEELQSSSEELETTNEELQSAVEELETTNEELQSTNEELETMNEELQSTNEELQTLNDELRDRTRQVDDANTFLEGILGALDIAVVVVDADHRVALWNGGAERLTGLRSHEAVDRRLLDLPLNVPADALRRLLLDAVLDGGALEPLVVHVRDRFGHPQLRRVAASALRPVGGERPGAVVTISDDGGSNGNGDGAAARQVREGASET